MPARRSWRSSTENPRGSTRWSRLLVARQRRALFPVFGGISGSINTTLNILRQKQKKRLNVRGAFSVGRESFCRMVGSSQSAPFQAVQHLPSARSDQTVQPRLPGQKSCSRVLTRHFCRAKISFHAGG